MIVLAIIAAAFTVAAIRSVGSLTRESVIAALEERFEARVELRDLRPFLFPTLGAEGLDLTIHHKGDDSLPPVIRISSFRINAGYWGLLRNPKCIEFVRLDGLEIVIARRSKTSDSNKDGSQDEPRQDTLQKHPFEIENIVADGTTLTILPKNPYKEPLIFELKRMALHSVGINKPFEFQSLLTNAKPPGEIETTGEFGPWNQDDAGLTPLSGQYVFQNADLSVFKGIGGILSSTGRFRGVLERIAVTGKTDTPDFVVEIAGNPIHLKTEFTAVVDGTSGDTELRPVVAKFGETELVANGGVVGTPNVKGKTVSLQMQVTKGRVEDVLSLAVKSKKPLVVGKIAFNTAFVLPPGDEDVIEKLRLHGRFAIDRARFTSINIQEKIDELSRRGRGIKELDKADQNVISSLKGRFQFGNERIRLDEVSFAVPGAGVELAGTYMLRSEELAFTGTLEMQAKLSQATTGIKSLFLKVVDPFFRHDGKTVLPIRVTGVKDRPAVGLNLRNKNKSGN